MAQKVIISVAETLGVFKYRDECYYIFKGRSSKVICVECSNLREFLWDDSLWADGYFAATKCVQKYIKNQ